MFEMKFAVSEFITAITMLAWWMLIAVLLGLLIVPRVVTVVYSLIRKSDASVGSFLKWCRTAKANWLYLVVFGVPCVFAIRYIFSGTPRFVEGGGSVVTQSIFQLQEGSAFVALFCLAWACMLVGISFFRFDFDHPVGVHGNTGPFGVASGTDATGSVSHNFAEEWNPAVSQWNPTTGLPMVNGCIDVGGNLYGASWRRRRRFYLR